MQTLLMIKHLNHKFMHIKTVLTKVYPAVIKIQQWYRCRQLDKYLINLQKTKIHKYIKFMKMVDRCKRKFKSKTRSMHARKIIMHDCRMWFSRKTRVSLRRIGNALCNLLEFGKYVLAQKEYSLASLAMSFDAELIRRCDRDSTNSAIILQARLLSEVDAEGPPRKIKIK